MHDQRVVRWSALGGKDFGGSRWIEGKSTEAIDGLCWKSDDTTFCQVLNGGSDGVLSLWIRVYRSITRESNRLWVAFENLCLSCHGHEGEIALYGLNMCEQF